jgi:starch-binding outer membrane protein, SusD/RagB family
MKNKKYLILAATAVLFARCGDDFLNQKNLYEKFDVDYYKTETDVAEALTGAYSVLPSDEGLTNPTLMSNLMSDDCFGGGGAGDLGFHDLDAFTNQSNDNYYHLWTEYYKGILRTNMLIKRFDQATFDNEDTKNQAHGEAYFLRAYFYFTLAQFFGNVPLVLDPSPSNLEQAEPDVMYAQIASDMKKAIELMPAKKFQDIDASRLGHANKWVAESYMARIFLFYTGYYGKTELPLAEGGTITKDQVITWVDDCIANSGHGLIPDFRNIWPYSYVNVEYPYAANNNLSWVGEGKDNIETMFAIKYSVFADWSTENKITYCNQLSLYMSVRYQTNLVPWSTGWGGGPVNPMLRDSYEPGDIRMKGSILDVTDPEENAAGYLWGQNQLWHETGLWAKKVAGIEETSSTGSVVGMFVGLYPSTPSDYQRWNLQDQILLRFADVLLMGAELGSPNAQDYLDQIRERAGLTSVPVTLDNIKKERRHELAFEGVRYFDLLRWHDAETEFAKCANIPVKNENVDDTYTATYRPETGGFLPIPETEISLSNGVLKQNPGWE